MTICIDAFKNLNIQIKNNGIAVSPCCFSPTRPTSDLNFVSDPYLQKIRSDWNNNQWPNECRNCKLAEQQSIVSRRQDSNRWYTDKNYHNTNVELIRLDYWVGDTCNLACVICGPENSSKWKQELNFPLEEKRTVVNKVWKSIDLTNIKFIHFNGGEPLLNKEHVEFLQQIPDKSIVHLNYNTNGTVLPNQKLIDLWSQFLLVQIDISIDDIGERFEYQRYPANWQETVKNLQWFIDNCPPNCMFATNTSVGVLNHDNIENLMSWLSKNFYANKYTDLIEHRTQSTVGIFALNNAQYRKETIVNTLDNCDKRRGTDWKKIFPNLLNYLNSK